MFKKKLFAVVMLLALVVSLVASCAPTPQVPEEEATEVPTVEVEKAPTPTPKPELRKGGTLVINDPDSNTSLDPFVTSWHSYPHYALYATLLAKDENLEYVGYLADTWEISEDGKTVTIKLIDYATFSDGTPVNAEAIKWNMEHFIDPEVGSSAGAMLIDILEEVEVVDEYTFKMHLASSHAPLYETLTLWEIVSPTAYEKWGVDDFGTHPVGAGPFLFKELVTDNYVVLERNPDFKWAPEEIYDHPGPVYLDEFVVKFIGEEQTALSALETGEIHFVPIPAQNLADMKANPDVHVHSQMQNQIRYIGYNCSKAPWGNPDLCPAGQGKHALSAGDGLYHR